MKKDERVGWRLPPVGGEQFRYWKKNHPGRAGVDRCASRWSAKEIISEKKAKPSISLDRGRPSHGRWDEKAGARTGCC
jgi:hypothetical protein